MARPLVADEPVRSGSLCGRRCLMLLLTCLFENPMSRRMVAEYASLHLLMPTTAGAGCFPPAIAPRAWQSLPHAIAQLGRCRYLAQQREQRIHLDQLADCHHLPLHVVEQLLVGNLLGVTTGLSSPSFPYFAVEPLVFLRHVEGPEGV